MTLSRPRTTRRVLRGSALGLGLLVAGGVTAPAAYAVVDTTDEGTEVPAEVVESPAPLQETSTEGTDELAPALEGDFGSGKDFTVEVDPYGPVPGDLDLSGAVFRATPVVADDDVVRLAGDDESYTCTTDVAGRCSFDGPNEDTFPFPVPFPGLLEFQQLRTADRVDVDVPVGTYTLTQVSSSPGLAAATGSTTFTICDEDCELPFGVWGEVGNDSLFRTSLLTVVTDADTDEPLACAGYELSGPDYPHDGSLPAAEPVTGPVPAECAAPTTAPSTSASPSTTVPTTTAPETTDESDPDATTDPTGTTTSTTTSTSTTTTSPSPVVLDLAADDEPLVTFGTQVSDSEGTMTFLGYFIPGDGYLLTPTATPDGYTEDVTDAFAITTTPQQAAAEEPAAVARTLSTGLAGGAPAPSATTAAAATTTAAAGATAAATPTTPAPAAAAVDPAVLATTGSPVGTMALVGTGLVALGGGALATGGILRRRARRSA